MFRTLEAFIIHFLMSRPVRRKTVGTIYFEFKGDR